MGFGYVSMLFEWNLIALSVICVSLSIAMAILMVMIVTMVRLRAGIFISLFVVTVGPWLLSIAVLCLPTGGEAVLVAIYAGLRALNWRWLITPSLACIAIGIRYLRWRSPPPGQCHKCGYNLYGLPKERTHCPECGCEIKQKNRPPANASEGDSDRKEAF